jgi:hypothetical protein
VVDILVSTPFVLSAINAVIAGVIGALLLRQLGTDTIMTVVLAVIGAILAFAVQVLLAARGIAAEAGRYSPKFPGRVTAPPGTGPTE